MYTPLLTLYYAQSTWKTAAMSSLQEKKILLLTHLYLCQQSVDGCGQLLNLFGHLLLALLQPVHHLIEALHVFLQVFDLHHTVNAIRKAKRANKHMILQYTIHDIFLLEFVINKLEHME